jgi:hypothetical protein
MKQSKFNWDAIQRYYDLGFSQRDVIKEYGMSSKTITMAVRTGRLKTRSRSEAASIHNEKVPRTQSLEFKNKQRERINARYESGWMPKAGRCKKYKYVSPIAGEISLDGTWELAVAKWLDSNGFHWYRNTKRFEYTNLKETVSHYTPDFWVDELQSYIEVKGYETELDRCKWSQFTYPLLVWKKKELVEMKLI